MLLLRSLKYASKYGSAWFDSRCWGLGEYNIKQLFHKTFYPCIAFKLFYPQAAQLGISCSGKLVVLYICKRLINRKLEREKRFCRNQTQDLMRFSACYNRCSLLMFGFILGKTNTLRSILFVKVSTFLHFQPVTSWNASSVTATRTSTAQIPSTGPPCRPSRCARVAASRLSRAWEPVSRSFILLLCDLKTYSISRCKLESLENICFNQSSLKLLL